VDNRVLIGAIVALIVIIAYLVLQQPTALVNACGDGWCDKETELESCPQDCP